MLKVWNVNPALGPTPAAALDLGQNSCRDLEPSGRGMCTSISNRWKRKTFSWVIYGIWATNNDFSGLLITSGTLDSQLTWSADVTETQSVSPFTAEPWLTRTVPPGTRLEVLPHQAIGQATLMNAAKMLTFTPADFSCAQLAQRHMCVCKTWHANITLIGQRSRRSTQEQKKKYQPVLPAWKDHWEWPFPLRAIPLHQATVHFISKGIWRQQDHSKPRLYEVGRELVGQELKSNSEGDRTQTPRIWFPCALKFRREEKEKKKSWILARLWEEVQAETMFGHPSWLGMALPSGPVAVYPPLLPHSHKTLPCSHHTWYSWLAGVHVSRLLAPLGFRGGLREAGVEKHVM